MNRRRTRCINIVKQLNNNFELIKYLLLFFYLHKIYIKTNSIEKNKRERERERERSREQKCPTKSRQILK